MSKPFSRLRPAKLKDPMSRRQRSECMSKIRGKDTKVEIQLRKAIWSKGLRFRLHSGLPGTPDLAFPRSKVALFIDGCFWHGCPMHGVRPKTNRAFWAKKLKQNFARDERTNLELRKAGWKVVRCWEHDVEQGLDRVVSRVTRIVSSRQQ
jgi:DNA mismatch endonuclease, patch repair protein